MARDRLSALRAQQQGGYSYNVSYPSRGSGRRYQSDRPTLYAQEGNPYEMSQVPMSNTSPNDAQADGDMSAFYSEISTVQDILRTFNDNVSRISDLHSRSLNNMDRAAAQRNASQLDGLVEETSALSNQLKIQIKNLQKQHGGGRDGQIRKQHTGLVKQKFIEAIQNYQQVEQRYRSQYKQRMERQFKTIKPDATPEEVKAVVEDGQDVQIFAQALQSSNHYRESRAAYREVQERHEDITRIERTLGELAQLFNDMSILVVQQDETMYQVQSFAMNVENNAEVALQHSDKAVSSARAARKKKWLCLVVVLAILLIVGLIIGIVVALVLVNQNNNNN